MFGRSTDVHGHLRRPPILSVIGGIVVVVILLVIMYFAWVGWQSRGRPVPDVDIVKDDPAGGARTQPADN